MNSGAFFLFFVQRTSVCKMSLCSLTATGMLTFSNRSLGLTTSRIWVCCFALCLSPTYFDGIGSQSNSLFFFFFAESTVLLPSIVAVSGTVGSETPIKSEHSGILSVILQETVCVE